MIKTLFLSLLVAMFSLSSCASKDSIRKALLENPEILFEVIEKNPEKFAESMQKANQQYRKIAQVKAEQEAKDRIDAEFKNPKVPEITAGRAMRGPKEAPILIVEYSDFECPYCQRGYETMEAVRAQYGDKVRFIYKHIPLSFHQNALPAAKYFEAISLQSGDKAYQFHDYVFKNQSSLAQGEKFLQAAAKTVGADLGRLKKDLNSPEVSNRIEADKAEGAKFGFSGTPAFLVNGVGVAGAYPPDHFAKIIDRHLGTARDTASK